MRCFNCGRENIPLADVVAEGEIVKMCQECSSRENVLVLRKPLLMGKKGEMKAIEKKIEIPAKRVFRSLNYERNNVANELIPNFQWEVAKARRHLNLTRKKVAQAIGESEENIKLIENGELPRDDFVFINKLQKYLGINLRKDKIDVDSSPRAAVETKAIAGLDYLRNKEKKIDISDKKESETKEDFFGDEIEIEEKE